MTTDNMTPQDEALVNSLIDIIKQAASPETQAARNLIMRRIALAGDLVPSRLPAPKNITELGGYVNLLETIGQPDLRDRMLASILGIAEPGMQEATLSTGPVLFYGQRANDRPDCPQQASLPVFFSMRSDFLQAFDAALAAVHDVGCSLPLQATARALPPFGEGTPSADDMLVLTGRTMEIAPSAALIDPSVDPLSVASVVATDKPQVIARQIVTTASHSADLTASSWLAWKCEATTAATTTVNGRFLLLTPLMNAAGWYQAPLSNPESLAKPGAWTQWTNITGLVANRTTLGSELRLLYSRAEITASALRERLTWVWDGQKFAAP